MSTTSIQREELWGHPKGLYVLFFTEMWERFSYYGMRALLMFYMTTSAIKEFNPGLGWDDANAYKIYGWYTMLVYVMSIPGGIIADKLIGQKKAVLFGGLILVAGHTILAIEQNWAFFTGLILIIIGVGGLKPNISTMVGGLYSHGDVRRDMGFNIFYIGINVGAFLAGIIVGAIGEKVGWHYGFGLAGIGMLLGQIVFVRGKKYLVGVGEPPKIDSSTNDDHNTSLGELFGKLLKSKIPLLITVLIGVASMVLSTQFAIEVEVIPYSLLGIFIAVVVGLMIMVYQDIDSIEKDRFIVLIISFLIVIVFWGAFEQAGGLMNLYTKEKIDRVVPLYVLDILFAGGGLYLLFKGVRQQIKKQSTSIIFFFLGSITLTAYALLRYNVFIDPYEIPASNFQSVNSLFIMIFGTVVAGIWIKLQKMGKETSSLYKMAIGTMIMGFGFLFMTMAVIQTESSSDGLAGVYWLILAYLFHTIGELCASPVALSFITKVAPVRYVSVMMGVYFAATGFGNKIAGMIGEASQEAGELWTFMSIFIFTIAFGLFLIVFLKKLKALTHGAEDLVTKQKD